MMSADHLLPLPHPCGCWLSSSLLFTLWSSWSEVKQSASSLFYVPHILLSASWPCIPPQHDGWSAQWSSERGQIQTELAEWTAEADETSYFLKNSLCVVTHARAHKHTHAHTHTSTALCLFPACECGVHSFVSTVFKPRVDGSRLDKDYLFPVCWKIECITLRYFHPFQNRTSQYKMCIQTVIYFWMLLIVYYLTSHIMKLWTWGLILKVHLSKLSLDKGLLEISQRNLPPPPKLK